MREPYKLQSRGIEYEDVIVWLLPLKEIVGVKEKVIVTRHRGRKPKLRGPGVLVGYSVLMEGAPNNGTPGCFVRRQFILDPDGLAPDKLFPGVSLDKCRE